MKQYLKALRQYADFKGRASRDEFWMFTLYHILITVMFAVICVGISALTENAGAVYLLYLYVYAVLIPNLAVMVRRLHDTERSAWFLLVSLIPLIVFIWLLVVLIKSSDLEDNRYGKNPLTTLNTRYPRIRSAAVALMISAVFWFLLTFSSLIIGLYDNGFRLVLLMLISAGLFLTGAVLFSKRKLTMPFTTPVAFALLFVSVVWLIQEVYRILNIFDYLLASFDLQFAIGLFTVFIPVALLLTGVFILLKQNDRTVPACLLFVGSGIWILSMIFTLFSISIASSVQFILNNTLTIAVPVSLMVFARTLLSKSKSGQEYESYLVTEQFMYGNKVDTAVQLSPLHATNQMYGDKSNEPEPVIKPHEATLPVVKPPVVKPPVTLPLVTERPLAKPPVVNQNNVNFIRKGKEGNNIWVVYKAPSKTDAMAFLSKQMINQPCYYVVVETPEGNFGRDKDGVYQE